MLFSSSPGTGVNESVGMELMTEKMVRGLTSLWWGEHTRFPIAAVSWEKRMRCRTEVRIGIMMGWSTESDKIHTSSYSTRSGGSFET